MEEKTKARFVTVKLFSGSDHGAYVGTVTWNTDYTPFSTTLAFLFNRAIHGHLLVTNADHQMLAASGLLISAAWKTLLLIWSGEKNFRPTEILGPEPMEVPEWSE